MFHASCMTWDFLWKSIELLSKSFRVIVPVMPGYDMEEKSDYTSVEEIAKETEQYIMEHLNGEIDLLYGISMGGSIVIKMLANDTVKIKKALIDAGITPVQLPPFLSNFIVLRDYSFMMTLKNSMKLFSLFVSKEKYGEGAFDRLRKVMLHASRKTIWNNFKSCNTYSMPEMMKKTDTKIWYWYGSKEKHTRKRDIAYVKKMFPQAILEEISGFNHAEFVMLEPEAFVKKVKELDEE